MYNYGVIDNTYVIVMKKYECSLRDWCLERVRLRNEEKERISHSKGKNNRHGNVGTNSYGNLGTVLSIYYEVLKIVKVLHEHNITHYDIKGDNIMLEFN